MQYLMKAGTLYEWKDGQAGWALARLQSRLHGIKTVLGPDGGLLLRLSVDRTQEGGTARREYRLCGPEGNSVLLGRTEYAAGEDPADAGWPVFRAPRVDHAALDWQGERLVLTMQNSQNYRLTDEQGETALQVIHRGLTGGWIIETRREIPAAVLCGMFAFCRLIELENEFAAG